MRMQGSVRVRLSHHGEVSFQGGAVPDQVMEMEAKGNVC